MSYTANVSSIQDFMQCRFRWLCKWVLNRVPRQESPALEQGKLLHLIFEDVLKGTHSMKDAIDFRCSALPAGSAAVEGINDLKEALLLWKDHYQWDIPVLEVEEPFVIPHPMDQFYRIKGRPDRVGVMNGYLWHIQNRGLAASMNFGVYMELATRHYHEHVYAEALSKKYPQYTYGGTMFNLVRKLKYRTNAGKKNESVKSYDQMFFQHPMVIDMDSNLHKEVMHAMLEHMREMYRVEQEWSMDLTVPPPNEKMNGGFSGSSIDPYFRVLTGKVDIMDDTYFKDREDTYANTEGAEQ